MKIRFLSVLLMAGAMALTGCSGAASTASPPSPSSSTTEAGKQGPRISSTIAVPNSTTPPFSFDIGYVEGGKYYIADRTNAAVDVIDTKTNKLTSQITGGFAGSQKTSSVSGPDGIVGIPDKGTIYVGDVNSVKVIDTATQKVTKTIPVTAKGFRVDEGCYDPDDNLIMFASPDDSPPLVTFISTKTQSVVGQLEFKDSEGLEACQYDPKSKSFLINNDKTPANPLGQIDVIPAASAAAGAPAVSKSAPVGDCSPTGMILGPNNEMLIGCNPPDGKALTSLILDRTSLATIATVPFGGSDQVDYDPGSNKYIVSGPYWVPGGIASKTGRVPTLGLIDGANHSLSSTVPVGGFAHSVAVDSTTGQVYVPFTAAVPAFPNGGIQVLTTR